MKLGFIRKEKKRDEVLFDFPYLTMEPRPTELGKVHKFRLKGENVGELLELGEKNNKLSWLFDENKDYIFYLINVTSVTEEVDPLITLNIGLDFNNKQLHDRMINLMGLNPEDTHYFKLKKVESGIYNLPAVEIERLIEESNTTKGLEEALEDINYTSFTDKEDILSETLAN